MEIKKEEIKVNESEVRKVMRYRSIPKGEVKSLIQQQSCLALNLISPKVMTKKMAVRVEGEKLFFDDTLGSFLYMSKVAMVFSYCEEAILLVATIGEGLEDEVKKLMEKKKYDEAYVLDACGSALVEKIIDVVLEKIKLENKNKVITRLYSPGYCGIPLSDQKVLFEMLNPEMISVRLSEECFMVPRKSISGIVGIGESNVLEQERRLCRACEAKECSERINS